MLEKRYDHFLIFIGDEKSAKVLAKQLINNRKQVEKLTQMNSKMTTLGNFLKLIRI
jgi:hypothetical protein